MLFSVFTPCHNAKWLSEAHSSLLLQGQTNWEWILVPNKMSETDIPQHIRNDPRVRIRPFQDSPIRGIGALKRFACEQAAGDVLVELDYDDMLCPRTLEQIGREVDKGAGFIYSDTAVFGEKDLKAIGYDPSYGWQHYPVRIYGHLLWATKNFDLSARSLAEVHFAPDHVRCWTQAAYKQAGGHDPNLPVGDDHDLMCRTYLTGAKFAHTGHCGYMYRVHGNNSVSKYNREIQAIQAANRRRYTRLLVQAWAKRVDRDWADLGQWLRAGWNPAEKELPVEPNSLAYIQAYNVLQYLTAEDVVNFFNRAWEALMPGGWILLDVPSSDDMSVFQDPKHKSYHNRDSFQWYCNRDYARANPNIACRFQLVQAYDEPLRAYLPKGSPAKLYARADLMALKDGHRLPGKWRI